MLAQNDGAETSAKRKEHTSSVPDSGGQMSHAQKHQSEYSCHIFIDQIPSVASADDHNLPAVGFTLCSIPL